MIVNANHSETVALPKLLVGFSKGRFAKKGENEWNELREGDNRGRGQLSLGHWRIQELVLGVVTFPLFLSLLCPSFPVSPSPATESWKRCKPPCGCGGVVVRVGRRMNEVNPRRARLVLGWGPVCHFELVHLYTFSV